MVNNGEGGWLCRDKNSHNARFIETVDLFEDRLQNGDVGRGAILPVEGRAWDIYQAKLDFIKSSVPLLETLIEKHPLNLKKVFHLVSYPIEVIEDGSLIFRPSPNYCPGGLAEYVQIANFLIDGNLVVSSEIWSSPAFSEMEKAALLLHEHIYWVFRQEFDEQNSSRVRDIVGDLFSSATAFDLVEKINFTIRFGPGERRDDWIATFPVQLNCVGSVSSQATSKVLDKQSIAVGIGKKITFSLGDFEFAVWASPEDGVPIYMSIENKVQKQTTYLSEQDVRPVFISQKTVSLKMLSQVSDAKIAWLHCENKSSLVNP